MSSARDPGVMAATDASAEPIESAVGPATSFVAAGEQVRANDAVASPAYKTMDMVRTLAAACVVWSHCFNTLFDPTTRALTPFWHIMAVTAGFGRDAVLVFFVVSGYWIASSVVTSVDTGSWRWRGYLSSRLSRLWTVLLPAMLLGGLLDYAGRYLLDLPIYGAVRAAGPHYDVGEHLGPLVFIGNLAFTQTRLVAEWGSNGPLWSLSNEFWYYMWFPALYLAWRRRISPAAIAVGLAAAFFMPSLLLLFPCWLAGVGLFFLHRHWLKQESGGKGQAMFWVVPAALLWLALNAVAHLDAMPYWLSALMVSLGFACFLATILRFEVGPPSQATPLVVYGARSSFSLYATHFPLMLFAIGLLAPDRAVPLELGWLAVAIALALALVGFGYIFSLGTESYTPKVRALLARVLTFGFAPASRR